ncbi:hypothetical protein RJT34_32009 [Clitoria ternatea]|uniref:Uncharacterized protein n=1 Tax=Clitoria ternatea TaxID=43366 RepID=A0AAN9I5H7_CLITE
MNVWWSLNIICHVGKYDISDASSDDFCPLPLVFDSLTPSVSFRACLLHSLSLDSQRCLPHLVTPSHSVGASLSHLVPHCLRRLVEPIQDPSIDTASVSASFSKASLTLELIVCCYVKIHDSLIHCLLKGIRPLLRDTQSRVRNRLHVLFGQLSPGVLRAYQLCLSVL